MGWKDLFGSRSPQGDAPPPDAAPEAPLGEASQQEDVNAEMAAAIGVALHCHLLRLQRREPLSAAPTGTEWQLAGRIRIMGERLRVFQRR